MITLKDKLKGASRLLTAVALAGAAALPALVGFAPAYAAGQVTGREIEMSSSAIGTGSLGQSVKYKVTFTPATSGAQSLVLDFCDTAIIGGACTAPAGLSVSSSTLSAGTGTSNWTATFPTASTVKLTKGASGSALGTTAVDFTINNVKNPTAVGSFYARITTYSDTAFGGGSAYASPASPGAYVDYGGFALSTTNTVTISATVMETLTFCVSGGASAPGAGCTGTSAPSIVLGSGTPVTLGTTKSTAPGYMQVSTNAVNGVTIRLAGLKSDGSLPACAGLSRDNGATCPIAAVGGFASIGNGSAKFGLNVGASSPASGGSGTVSADSNYGTLANSYGMDDTNVIAAYGDVIATSTGAVDSVNSPLEWAAAAAATTPAGVYTANESLVATGRF